MKHPILIKLAILLSVTLLVFSAGSCVQTPAWIPPVQAPARTGPALFRLSHTNATMYFFGSVHIGTTDFYPLPDIVEEAFKESENLVVEFNTQALSPIAAYMLMSKHLMYPATDSLNAHLSPGLVAKLDITMSNFGIMPIVYRQMKPILVDMTLTALASKNLGYDETLGVDVHFLTQAVKLGKTIYELESAEEQFNYIAAIPEDTAILSLSTTVDEISTLGESLARLVSAWKTGDLQALEQESNRTYLEHPGLKPVSDILIDKRNMSMTNRLEALVKKGGTYFVVVGAMHISGEGSIVDLMSKRGYVVQRL
ncbi:MAG: TraB/GumN family protein [Spirochaetaceae bacterium]|nr:MAG: TraB/GumN family protein [Spirochaetaceae bacterium]